MNSATDFISIAACNDKLRVTLRQLKRLADGLDRGTVVFGHDIALASELFVTSARQLVSSIDDNERRLIATMLIDECRKLDLAVGYSSPAFIAAVYRGMSHDTCDTADDRHTADLIKATTRPVSAMSVVDESVRHCARVMRASSLGEIVVESNRLGGLRGRFDVVKSVGQNIDTIELVCGCVFAVNTVDQAGLPWTRQDVACCIIDGFIESVSEIDALLAGAHSEKKPIVIVCRGHSQDVSSTVALNRKRGTLDAQIVTVPYDVLGSNLLKDIAAVCKTDVISVQQGRLLSSVRFDSLARVDRVTITAGSLVIENAAQTEIQTHLKQLLDMKRGADDVVDERIRGLLDTRVRITLSGAPLEAQSKTECLDMLMRSARNTLAHGTIDTRAIDACEKQTQHGLLDVIIERLVAIHGICPASTCLATFQHASQFIRLFQSESAGLICAMSASA